MKKIIIAVVVLLLLGGGGAGYYYFFMKEEPMESSEDESSMMTDDQKDGAMDEKPIMDLSMSEKMTQFFVKERKLPILSDPSEDAVIEGYLYKGEEVEVLEKRDKWARISDYIVFEEGGMEVAEWISLEGLSNEEVVISKEEGLEILDSYLEQSDDLKVYRQQFRDATQELLNKGDCSPEDFEELGGWVKSIKYKGKEVYFIYCGGMKLENKIYLDVVSKETFVL